VARFVSFEGLDGSGKSTHVARLARRLAAAAVPHVVTREPGGTDLGAAIRGVFLDHRFGGMDGIVELLLVFAARRQHLLEVIEPSLTAARHVLCDRFTDSTVAYQGYGRGVPLDAIARVDQLATGGRRPDRTLLFDLPPTEARRRGRSGTRRRDGSIDRLDVETLAFYERARVGYLTLAHAEPERFRVIDSAGPPDATAAAVDAALADLFPPVPA
jgi:dTMP kinase